MENMNIPSRLEINFNRLLDVTQQMANGDEPKEWLFEKKILILYGSETGSAQEMAESIYRTAIRKSMLPEIKPMNDITIAKLIAANIVVFVAATTGQGEDPENMKQFFQSLWKQRNDRTLLKSIQFAVLGLGDSSYQKFNYAAKRLNNLLLHLGAKQLQAIGLCDDQHDLGPDYVADSWLIDLFGILHTIYPDKISKECDVTLLPSKYEILPILIDEKGEPIKNFKTDSYDQKNPYKSILLMNKKKCAINHFQDVRLLEFDIKLMNSGYNPGDVLMVQPQNTDANVEKFISLLGLDGNKKILVHPNDPAVGFPHWYMISSSGCTIRECIKKYLDIQSVPKRYFFELLSFFTTNELEKEKFIELSSSIGQEELYNYCIRPKRTILEVLSDFPHTHSNLPLDYLFDLIPPIKPRAYSIASSHLAMPGKVQILVALVEYKTNLMAKRVGLCSNWLANLSLRDEVYVWIKAGGLKFPNVFRSDPSPVMMIGPGTGCAPFRSFISESVTAKNKANILMIFGCRNRDKDYFFKDEWEHLSSQGKLNLLCAFSRDQNNKIYVQHLIRQHSVDIWKFISNENADIFYVGNAKRIPIDVYEALLYVCEKEGNLNTEEAKAYFKNSVEKRYQTECWA